MQRRYFADVTPEQAWEALTKEPGAALVDVRTAAEWSYVGLPDISGTRAPLFRLEWQKFPTGEVNRDFVEMLDDTLQAKGFGRDAPVYFLCRSGGRSAYAAAAMTAAGYTHCSNIVGGFEGDRNGKGHRGSINGWKAAGLPWVQS